MNKLERLKQIDLEEYNYPLPDERIAKYPLEKEIALQVMKMAVS